MNGDGTAASESTVDEAPAPARRRRVASRPAGSPRKGAATADGGAATTDEAPAARSPCRPRRRLRPPSPSPPRSPLAEQPAEAPPAAPTAVETDGDDHSPTLAPAPCAR